MNTTAEISVAKLNDDDLIRDTLAGDKEAFGALMQKYKNSLFDMACRILGNAQEAEDVLQDSFIKAYQHLASFNHQARFSTWLYSIVLNRVRNRLRRNKTIWWQSLDASASRDGEAPPIEMPDKSPSIPDMTDSKLQLEAVQRAVTTLPVEHQSIFILHYMQNLPLQDIADRLGRPVGTVAVYLHRARKALFRKLSSGQKL